jgi:uncharacterized protein YccT (UPF0319 family)
MNEIYDLAVETYNAGAKSRVKRWFNASDDGTQEQFLAYLSIHNYDEILSFTCEGELVC